MDIVAATRSYEAWLFGRIAPVQADLEYKHRQMADPADPFPFFRGTYYRWVQHWATAAGDLAAAPAVLAVGDLHVENYGTWRDGEGRLVWGVNDFDEADRLPYTNDLVRLAASARFAHKDGGLGLKLGVACRAVLAGYREALAAGGVPFVLEERHPELRALAMAADREPIRFWKKLTAVLADPPAAPPPAALEALTRDLPADGLVPQYRARPRVGMGSLGKPRFVALAEWAGGWVAREAKTVAPPATAWAAGGANPGPSPMAEAVARAVRCHDPFYRPGPEWIARRLAPRCSRIELAHLTQTADAERLLRAMGGETANVHLGTAGADTAILADLKHRPDGWLEAAARSLGKLVEDDWQQWRATAGHSPSSPSSSS
jgi:hypothetical protein